MTEQDFTQGRLYYSASHGRPLEIKRLPIPHAQRALEKLLRDGGEPVIFTPLAHALYLRVEQGQGGEATATDIPAIGGGYMLRGRHGRFTGAYAPSPPREVH